MCRSTSHLKISRLFGVLSEIDNEVAEEANRPDDRAFDVRKLIVHSRDVVHILIVVVAEQVALVILDSPDSCLTGGFKLIEISGCHSVEEVDAIQKLSAMKDFIELLEINAMPFGHLSKPREIWTSLVGSHRLTDIFEIYESTADLLKILQLRKHRALQPQSVWATREPDELSMATIAFAIRSFHDIYSLLHLSDRESSSENGGKTRNQRLKVIDGVPPVVAAILAGHASRLAPKNRDYNSRGDGYGDRPSNLCSISPHAAPTPVESAGSLSSRRFGSCGVGK